ncbi:MAG: lipopolysaccharide biosynthesis protein [Roseitalea sp.]|nr:lipopolysaccharide biosynthesis protein [Roseitalea sp.]MBO6722607.1 lipopolysaccharide biosynthesis protein [Roseitalea sp.]MBO6745104.1 lipopolysaccharide biosynthesis protein [Roseitalea sp.]
MRFSAAHTIEQVFPEALSRRARPFADIVDRIVAGADEASQAQRMTLVAFAIRVASAAIAFLSQVALARLMGVFEYGVFVMVWVSMIIIGNLSCFGFHTAIVRFLPQYRERGDLDHLRGLLLSGRLFVLATSTVMAALAVAAAHFGAALFQSYYVVPFMIGALALPMIALGDTLDGTARANGWPIRALAPTYILRPLLILALLVGAWALGYAINGVTALICAVLAAYLTTVGQLVLVTVSLDRHFPAGPRRTQLPMWIAVALPIFLVEGFFFLLVNADVLMVGALMRPDDVAVYFATVKTLALVHFVYFAVKAGVAHRFAARIDDSDKSALHDLARRSVSWTFWPSLAMAGVILLIGPLLLALFGSDFGRGYPLLFILSAGVVLRAAIGPAESLLTMSGNQNACAGVFGAVLALNVTLNALLIPVYGLYGAALATMIATIAETFALYQLVRWRIGVRMFVFMPHAKTDR